MSLEDHRRRQTSFSELLLRHLVTGLMRARRTLFSLTPRLGGREGGESMCSLGAANVQSSWRWRRKIPKPIDSLPRQK